MRNKLHILSILLMLLTLTGCYQKHVKTKSGEAELTEHQLDSLSFYGRHHYTNGYNFVVSDDSVILVKQQPEEIISDLPLDSFTVYKNDQLVVADIRTIPSDSIDSVWVQVAKNQEDIGWIHENSLLKEVVPDDPISQFIDLFSNIHLIIFITFAVLVCGAYLLVKMKRRNVPMLYFNDIDTFYPTALCIVVAISATFYATLQLFATDIWVHFYFNPTLNPFSVPFPLNAFLASAWAILLMGIAAVDDVRRHLPVRDAALYIGGMFAFCAVNYVVFTLTTLYYAGYPLLIIYVIAVCLRFRKKSYTPYLCGNCGSQLHRKGRCPHCGTMNY